MAAARRFRPARRLLAALAAALVALLIAALLWAALAPLRSDSREKLFAIPDGTFKRRMAGDKVDILPPTITLTLGLRDVLLLRNDDSVPQQFGPVLIMPGQSFRLPFERESENQFDCAAHVSGKMTVLVETPPAPGLARIRWRWRELAEHFH